MSKLREEMIRAMKLRNFSDKTQESYLYQIIKLAGHYGKSPIQLTHRELQDYLIYMKEKLDLSFSSCNVARSAIRFLYGNVLKDEDIYIAIPAQRTPGFLPEVLSVEEVMALINATTKTNIKIDSAENFYKCQNKSGNQPCQGYPYPAPLLCNPYAGGRLRHSAYSKNDGPQKYFHHHDISSCVEGECLQH